MGVRSRTYALIGLIGLACRATPSTETTAASPSHTPPHPVPTVAPAEVGAPVGTRRVCWSEEGVPTPVARPVPGVPATSPLGWRCAWPGPARLCLDRRADVPAFTCAGERCAQAHARRPDDGEWTCVDTAGAVVCLGGERAAGVAVAPRDPAWICGARRGVPGARLCVDLSPDVPDGDAAAWRCRAVNGPAPSRVCERGATAGSLGVPCDHARPCVDGAVCVADHCAPARPAPSCWLDGDCAGGVCRFGTCRDEATP